MARCREQVTAHVLVYRPVGFADNWTQTDLWRSAAALPGVDVQCDDDSATARLFGAETSGHTVLYDNRGRLLFSGGITGGRGHFGDNAGLNAVVSLLRNETIMRQQAPVFGCSLFNH